jgi:hypothetical protein
VINYLIITPSQGVGMTSGLRRGKSGGEEGGWGGGRKQNIERINK